MDTRETGLVMSHLLRYRSIESRPIGRNLKDGEKECAKLLAFASKEERRQLEDLFVGQGFSLRSYDYTTMPGVPKDGQVWILARELALGNHFPVLNPEVVLEAMKDTRQESNRAAAIWFVHIWLLHLELIYADKGRSLTEMSRYVEGVFEFDSLVSIVAVHIESMRGEIDRNSLSEDAGFVVLEASKGGEIGRRCKDFVSLMLDAGLLCRIAKEQYQQTILSAYEMRENFSRGLQHYTIPENLPPAALAGQILTGATN